MAGPLLVPIIIRVGAALISATAKQAPKYLARFKNAKVISKPNAGQLERAQKITGNLNNFTKSQQKVLKKADTSRPSVVESLTGSGRTGRQALLKGAKTGERRRGTVVGVAGGLAAAGAAGAAIIKKLQTDLKKAKTEAAREKLRARISDEVGKVQEAKQKAKDKSLADSVRENTNTRRGTNMKVPPKRVSKDVPGVKKSLRPKLRPKEKMMGGGMATKKKPTGYMYGGMAKKPKAKK